jgi:hypothetical protein
MAKSLRERLVKTTLEWKEKYGVAPPITPTISEYDATRLVGMSEEEYTARERSRTTTLREFNFIYGEKRYRVQGRRRDRLRERPESIVIHRKPTNYDWDYIIWIFYSKSYVIEEAWLWGVVSYKEYFDQNDKMSLSDMRLGKYLEEDYQKPWLERLLNKSRSLNWCVKAYCTTCCCGDFRSHLVVLLSREIGFELPNQTGTGIRLSDAADDDITLCFKEIVKALEELPKSNLDPHASQALGIILIDLYAVRLVPSLHSSQPYMDIIRGTWVGESFTAMEEEAARREERHTRHIEETAAQVAQAEARREERRFTGKIRAKTRLEESRQRKITIKKFLDELSQCDERGRLLKLASEDLNIPLRAIPSELIPLDPQAISNLPRETTNRLIDRIGRRRKVWGKLKKLLIKYLNG